MTWERRSSSGNCPRHGCNQWHLTVGFIVVHIAIRITVATATIAPHRIFPDHFQHGHQAPKRLYHILQPQPPVPTLLEQRNPLIQLPVLAIMHLHHRQIPHPQRRLRDRRHRSGPREHGIHDDQLAAWLYAIDQIADDLRSLGGWPVVDDHAEEEDVNVFQGLRGEEVVVLVSEAADDG